MRVDNAALAAVPMALVAGLAVTPSGAAAQVVVAGDAFERRHNIPKYLPDALKRLKVSNGLAEVLGKDFITLYTEIKQTEHDAYQNVISAWEREHLLLNV